MSMLASHLVPLFHKIGLGCIEIYLGFSHNAEMNILCIRSDEWHERLRTLTYDNFYDELDASFYKRFLIVLEDFLRYAT